ncbi:dockerin type I domain-containing protein [Acetivibrio straminisolvens]|jgi:hypothetical protein|uniref:Dockerin domain-containing protein n=1 Tax=Acetivibrio straminisolvens JCM 21531 TaxID=1294263 RepID=W4V819_9FIRM|nr:dockerin type I domain-containing protein [Acetivibrio straminisolvens]GAE88894.1 hypothetical protein JCM21531_2376 [Acetivibrio straminisolvens JCM 21531]
MKKKFTKLFIGVFCLLIVLTNGVVPYWADAQNTGYKISGYVEPDFEHYKHELKSGFLVELVGYEKSVLSDSKGYFEIKDIPSNPSGYTVKISKDNYLCRLIDVQVTSDIQLGIENEPVTMWAGDINVDGFQDNAINMIDILQFFPCFNTMPEDEAFKADLDINKDGTINMEDVMIVAKHFNTAPSDYPDVPVIKKDDAEFVFKIKTTKNREVYQFPIAPVRGEPNIVVDWGDGTTSRIDSYLERTHIYESPDTYTIKVISFDNMPLFFNGDLKLVEVVTPLPDIGATSFFAFFYGCLNLTKIPDGLFDNNVNATDFGACFNSCASLTEIPAGLFAKNINATSFYACFLSCESLTEIPEGLFDNNINVTQFDACFDGCKNLTGTAPALWSRSNVTKSSSCFRDCTKLSNYDEIPDSWK